jgi:L-asparaginase
MRRITLVTTGGTIEKTYDEQTGELTNRQTLVRRMLGELRLEDTEVQIVELMSKDSLDLNDEDRQRIVEAVLQAGVEDPASGCSGVVVLHGTDTLARTGELIHARLAHPAAPVVLTGAWRPFEVKRSDALQNLTEAIFATVVLPPAVYCVAHGQVRRFPGVKKDRERKTFVGGVGWAP